MQWLKWRDRHIHSAVSVGRKLRLVLSHTSSWRSLNEEQKYLDASPEWHRDFATPSFSHTEGNWLPTQVQHPLVSLELPVSFSPFLYVECFALASFPYQQNS